VFLDKHEGKVQKTIKWFVEMGPLWGGKLGGAPQKKKLLARVNNAKEHSRKS